MKIAHVLKINTPIPQIGSGGGVPVAVANTAVYQAFLGKHDVCIYGSADSTIVSYASKEAEKCGFSPRIDQADRKVSFFNTQGRKSGSLELRTTGKNAIKSGPEAEEQNRETVEMACRDDLKYKFDVIQVHGSSIDFEPFVRKGLMGKVLGQSHYIEYSPAKWKHPVVAMTESHARLITEHDNANIIGIVPHGIPDDPEAFSPRHANYLACIGRIDERKGVDIAIAMAQQAGEILIVAGRPDTYEESQQFMNTQVHPKFDIEDENLLNEMQGKPPEEVTSLLEKKRADFMVKHPEKTDHSLIIYVGSANPAQKQTLLRNAAATLMPLRDAEAFGLVYVESMQAGTPVIGTTRFADKRIDTFNELVGNGIGGIGIEGNTEADIIAQAEDAIMRAKQLDRSAILAHQQKHFSMASHVADMDAVYGTFVKKKSITH